MSNALYPVPAEWAARAKINAERYATLYRESLEAPEDFWRREAGRLDWSKPFTEVSKSSFDEADFGISWFADGELNVAANCIDRHLAERGEQTAILWEPDSPGEGRALSYRQLHEAVCRLANGLLLLGVRKGDRVTVTGPIVTDRWTDKDSGQQRTSQHIAATDVAMEAVQLFGGNGYMAEYPVARFYRDAKILEIGEGTSEVQRMLIARDLGVG